MLTTAATTAAPRLPAVTASRPGQHAVAERIAETLRLLQDHVAITRRVVHTGEHVYQAGESFGSLHVIHSGFFKTVNLAPDGREQVVGLHFKGDWLGFDGIAAGQYGCDAVAMDTGEVWTVRYDALLAASTAHAPLLGLLHAAMSREITRDRDSLLSLCTLSADARVAEFLRAWADAMADRGLRNDQITLRMTRAEIGNYLGMTLETVSRALSRLSRDKLIAFPERGRRDVQIPDVRALGAYVQRSLSPNPTLQ
ncbi:Crp/Fnr family transcriptional regulator [Roseateles cellulosilyticus]|uniref:Helix-turn-helix domain-containing protein n=1 Tax=Pelomonas cellulosilytica TaxID=2906762 RepID=A0ABS8Y2A5_9BURK|nr:helix-turn-helix domain-containing protein [Pelomonas sp. P8]MCE4557091.1 helix-turn-helix domain-containing protein [Pelomonas sp. P8]